MNLAQKIRVDFTDDQITGSAGGFFLAGLAERFGLPSLISEFISLKQRKRGADDSQTLLSLIYSLSNGDGALRDVDRLGIDDARRQLLALENVPNSRRVGEYLTRFDDVTIERLKTVVSEFAYRVVDRVIEAERERLGYIPLFIDGTAIEVDGDYECAAAGYNKHKQYWLHGAYIGRMWAAGKLLPGGVDVAEGWEDLLHDAAFLLSRHRGVWLRADNAYYRREVIEFCKMHDWDYSLSVTHGVYKKPLLKQLDQLTDDDWQPLDDKGHEEAAWLVHKPSGWSEKELYLVIRTWFDGDQKLLQPRHTIILTSAEKLEAAEVVKRHRGKQGQENAQKGPLIDLDLHHPPCRRFNANRAFYLAAQIAQILLVASQYWLLPKQAGKHGLRTIIRDLVRLPGKLVRHGRTTIIKFSKNILKLDWIIHAADRLETLQPDTG